MGFIEFFLAQGDGDKGDSSRPTTFGTRSGAFRIVREFYGPNFCDRVKSAEAFANQHPQSDDLRNSIAHPANDHTVVLVLEQSSNVSQVSSHIGRKPHSHLVLWSFTLSLALLSHCLLIDFHIHPLYFISFHPKISPSDCLYLSPYLFWV